MKENVKRFFNNGGRERVIYWTAITALFIHFVKAVFGSGEYKERIEVNTRDIRELKSKIAVIEEIKSDIAELKTNQKRILEILQGRYRRYR